MSTEGSTMWIQNVSLTNVCIFKFLLVGRKTSGCSESITNSRNHNLPSLHPTRTQLEAPPILLVPISRSSNKYFRREADFIHPGLESLYFYYMAGELAKSHRIASKSHQITLLARDYLKQLKMVGKFIDHCLNFPTIFAGNK